MPLGTLDGTPPPFFRQGPSARSKLIFFSALALFLMVADTRLKLTDPLRLALATTLQPVQWLAMRPIMLAQGGGAYLQDLHAAQSERATARKRLAEQSQSAIQGEQLKLENARLRKLLSLRERQNTPSQAAQVVYDVPDPYSRKVVIDAGMVDQVQAGSPVLDELGVLGQVTRVYPLVSEVTLITDRDQAIPILNTRTGARGVAFGDPQVRTGAMELRFMAANADVQVGDLLSTSGVDGVYPPGLPVARVDKVDRRVDSAFARITCLPVALVAGALHVVVLQPVVVAQAPPAPIDALPAPSKKGGRK